MKSIAVGGLAALGLAIAPSTHATSFTNGGFETLTNGPGQLSGGATVATGWTVAAMGSIVAFAPGTADTTGAPTVPGEPLFGTILLWGTNDGGVSVLPATSPSGGDFVALDGAFGDKPLQQIITGLRVGATYHVGFDYGFGEQQGFAQDTIQNLSVTFAGVTQTTADYSVPEKSFTGWFHTSFDVVATSTTDTLSFLAYGSRPAPPFALLDGVTFTSSAVPEPATWALMVLGVGAVGAARRRQAAVAAQAIR